MRGGWTGRLWAEAAGTYAAILKHPFLAGLTDGSLDPELFTHYVVQDAHYLRDFVRTLTVVGSKAPTHAGVGMFARHAASTAEVERMESVDLEIATEFLLIAATLIELKSRRLLPNPEDLELDEELLRFEERDLPAPEPASLFRRTTAPGARTCRVRRFMRSSTAWSKRDSPRLFKRRPSCSRLWNPRSRFQPTCPAASNSCISFLYLPFT